jgi:4-hydroxy-tetrahydrodipicolinate reductase
MTDASRPATQAPVRLAILGANGRLGRQIAALAHADPRFRLTALLVAPESSVLGQLADVGGSRNSAALTYVASSVADVDVYIDVSLPDALPSTLAHMAQSATRPGALVSGVTGYSAPQLALLHAAMAQRAWLHSTNFSRGVTVLKHLAGEAARLLGNNYDVGILDLHHRQKRDAPSGTALALEAALTQGGATHVQHAALRLGTAIGEHRVVFAGYGESVTLTHSASTRDVFALGALDAAAWIAKKPAGQYSMAAVFGVVTPHINN